MSTRPPPLDILDPLLGKMREETGEEMRQSLAHRAELLRESAFPQQIHYLDDPSDRKAVLCPRRCGKTQMFVIDLLSTMLTIPHCKVAYISLTIKQAKRNFWDKVVELNDAFNLGLHLNITDLTAKAPNGSMLMIGGASNKLDVERYRGLSLEKAVVDEAGSFHPHILKLLLEDVLHYCLLDRLGTLTIGGTPGISLVGEFFEATYQRWDESERPDAFTPRAEVRDGKEIMYAPSVPYRRRNAPEYAGVIFSWSFHGWGMKDVPNHVIPDLWEREQAAHKRKGESDEDPKWIREAWGRWVKDDSGLVFRYDARKNEYAPTVNADGVALLPKDHDWVFVGGVDFGFEDEFAIEVIAYAPTLRQFYHVYEFCEPKQSTLDWTREMLKCDAAITKAYGRGVTLFCGDTASGGTAAMEDMREKHGIPIEGAKKSDKRHHIEMLNSELMAGRAKVMTGTKLATQLATVQWADPALKTKVHEKTSDDAADAYRYVVRHTFHAFGRAERPEIEKGSPEWWKRWEQEQIDKLVRESEAPRISIAEQLAANLGEKGHKLSDRMRTDRLIRDLKREIN